MAVLVMGGARHVWHNWVSTRRTVRWADETAQLEDRLATLVAHQRQADSPDKLGANAPSNEEQSDLAGGAKRP